LLRDRPLLWRSYPASCRLSFIRRPRYFMAITHPAIRPRQSGFQARPRYGLSHVPGRA
jgi:hypothetical protein